MDERKSFRWVIVGYAGAVAAIAAITVFVVRGMPHEQVVFGTAASTATPTIVNVYSGLRPDPVSPLIHAKKRVALAPSPVPAPSPSAVAEPSKAPSAAPVPKTAVAATKPEHKTHVHRSAHSADTVTATTASFTAPVNVAQVAPRVERAQPTQAAEPLATAVPTAVPAAAPADENAPIFAPERIVDAQVRVAVQPEFPEVDRARGERGTSVVLVTIDPKGNVVSASIGTSSGYPGLDRAAINAARGSQFVAPKINGHPATETYRVVYDFTP